MRQQIDNIGDRTLKILGFCSKAVVVIWVVNFLVGLDYHLGQFIKLSFIKYFKKFMRG